MSSSPITSSTGILCCLKYLLLFSNVFLNNHNLTFVSEVLTKFTRFVTSTVPKDSFNRALHIRKDELQSKQLLKNAKIQRL